MRKRRGFSLVEVMMVTVVLGFVLTGATALTMNVIRSFNQTTSQLDVDQGTSTAMQLVTRDLQEAKQITVTSPTVLLVKYPIVKADGSYNRLVLDDVNTVEFYRGSPAGVKASGGTCLIRKPASGTARVICKNVTELTFESNNPTSVLVTVKTQQTRGVAVGKCEMIHRAIFLRNY